VRQFSSLTEFARHLEWVARQVPKETEKALKETGQNAVRRAKAKIGLYQHDYVSPKGTWFPDWSLLSEATLWGGTSPSGHHYPGKVQLGYAPPDNPLLREGDLRNSIQFSLTGAWTADKLTLGSIDEVMLFHEHGTRLMPPRPVIAPSLAETIAVFYLKRQREAIERAFRVA
jgi:hypothetical protein